MIQYDIQNIELLSSQAASVRDWMRKSSMMMTDDEKEIIHFFEKIHKAYDKKDTLREMKRLYDQLIKNKDKFSFEASLDLIIWLESKLKQKPLAEILQQTVYVQMPET